jgi:fatty acid desaturase
MWGTHHLVLGSLSFGYEREMQLNPRINSEGSFLRTVVICSAGLVVGITLAATGTGGFWATALIIGAVIVPVATAYHVTKDGGRLRWSWRTSDQDPPK